ncbi:MAG: histidinol dehydrogenase [Bacteroidales bacterium]|nr:histidinol dehydrogenase [Bacteroidales bacterium]
MIAIFNNPSRNTWAEIVTRPSIENNELETTVKNILENVKANGDKALMHYINTFDNPNQKSLTIETAEIESAEKEIATELKEAIKKAAENIRTFHSAQKEPVQVIESMQGIKCWRKSIGIEKVGLYIPGGTAPLFSTILMLAIPAQIAECKEIILCTPEGKNGKIHPAILYTANYVGIKKIYKVGGAQAIAAMAFGTETIPKTYKIFGPGNQYVTMAKMLVNKSGTAIDMPAGPSEVMIVADKTANPEFIAADMLSQCEHGNDSQAVLLTDSLEIANKTITALEMQLKALPREMFASNSLKNSKIIILNSISEQIDFMNEYAAEHLILSVENTDYFVDNVINAGSVFIGNYSPESVGDYASGTNHTLPTNGYAKAYSGVSLDSFVKKITFQHLTHEGLENIAKTVEIMAEAEQLEAHKNAVSIRLKK